MRHTYEKQLQQNSRFLNAFNGSNSAEHVLMIMCCQIMHQIYSKSVKKIMRLSAVSMRVSKSPDYFIPCAYANSPGSVLTNQLTLPPPGWYFMLSVEPILERTFFRSGSGALVGRTFRGARGTGGFLSRGVCLGTGGLVMRDGRGVGVPLVAAVLVAEDGVRVVLGVVLTAKT